MIWEEEVVAVVVVVVFYFRLLQLLLSVRRYSKRAADRDFVLVQKFKAAHGFAFDGNGVVPH